MIEVSWPISSTAIQPFVCGSKSKPEVTNQYQLLWKHSIKILSQHIYKEEPWADLDQEIDEGKNR